MTEKLHNGIVLPADWPPDGIVEDSLDPLPVPYLDNPPPVVPIDLGRQLFVDDFLIADSDLQRRWRQATIHPASPVLTPATPLERHDGFCPVAAPFNDGAWYDPADGLFKLFYHAGWMDGTALAVSRDGIDWTRPQFDVRPGTNAVLPDRPGWRRDGSAVWLDLDAPPDERWKMFVFYRRPDGQGGRLCHSADGVHWSESAATAECGDNSSIYRDPFRKRWVFSVRTGWPVRARSHAAGGWPDFAVSPKPVFWARADRHDRPDPTVGDRPQLYDLNATPYESLMLGAFNIFYGPANEVCARTGRVKTIDMQLGFSRDGFHWHRPCREAFIPCSREPGTWNYGYIHAATGLCQVLPDRLHFYFGAFSGVSPRLAPGESGAFVHVNAMYAGGATGLATLRRDGFASLDADTGGGRLTTRPLVFSGRCLFVNLDAPHGQLRVEVLDERGAVIPPYTAAACMPVCGDSAMLPVRWDGAEDLAPVANRPVRLRFLLRAGSLYAFWVSPRPSGESLGYLAGGGPPYPTHQDVPRD